MQRLQVDTKRLRAEVIREYILEAGYQGCICFTCGNASVALSQVRVVVVEVSPVGPLRPGKWWRPEEVHRVWPHLFDATPGHLPAFLMVRLAKAIKLELGEHLQGEYEVPSGSGETILCLRWAYPNVVFHPIFDCGKGTEREPQAPLLPVVERTL